VSKIGIKPFYSLTEVGQLAGGYAAETIRGWIWEDHKHVAEDGWPPDDERIRFPNARPRGLVPLADVLNFTGLTVELLAMVDLDPEPIGAER
jgi:hypothetical protein